MLNHRRQEIALAVVLASSAGFVDAVGFVHLGGFFVSFMSGNTTRAGVALAQGNFHDLWLAGGLIGAFVLGVVGGSVLGHQFALHRRAAVLGLVGALLAVSAVLGSATLTSALAPPLLAAAMGAENAVFESEGEVRIGLTYMTGTLVKMGHNIAQRLVGRAPTTWPRYLSLWSGMAAGAVGGGVTYALIGFASSAVAAVFVLSVAVMVRVLGL